MATLRRATRALRCCLPPAAAAAGLYYSSVTAPMTATAAPPPPAAAASTHSAAHAAAATALRQLMPPDDVVSATDELAVYAKEAYGVQTSRQPPTLVLFPSSTDQVASIVKVCAAHGMPIVARGSGTSLEGHTLTHSGGVVIDFTKNMAAILAVRPADLDATVQPGLSWGDLNDALRPHNLFFPVDPGPGASLGGMAACGCSGTNAFKYGQMKQNVIGLTAVLADGTIVSTRGHSRARKSVSSYDLTNLLIGSEGTLALTTELVVRLSHIPPATAVATVVFPDVRSACAAAADMVASGTPLAAIELLDGPAYEAAIRGLSLAATAAAGGGGSASPTNPPQHPGPPTPRLFLKLAGPSASSIREAAEAASSVTARHRGSSFAWAADEAGQLDLWRARKEVLWSLQAIHSPQGRVVLTTDVCVPLSRLPDLVEAMETRAKASSLPVYCAAHAADGNCHHFICYDPQSPAEAEEAGRLKDYLVGVALGMDGTCTGEHGVGSGKRKYVEQELGGSTTALCWALKEALDPKGILNPGKKLPDRPRAH